MGSSSDFQDDQDSSSEDEWSSLKWQVLNCITEVKSSGSFATSGCFRDVVLPGISVDEVGAIPLPLSSHDAQSLIRASRQAPFGKGSETLVDETVRKTWEIDGSKVSFSNQAWHDWLKEVVTKAATDLGVAGNPDGVRAELHKMLLYEKGAMFKPHKDTEKISSMFGTLVICLPSEHVGGDVHLRHGQKEKTFGTSKLSAFNATYIAWYADVIHEIKPVESGYRWVLTYNLVSTSSSSLRSAAGLDDRTGRFCQILANWRGIDKGPACLCYALDYQYTDAGLKLANLKGNDYNRARYVTDSCGEAGDFCVLLASLKKVVTFANDEGGEDEAQSQMQLARIFDTEGFTLRHSLDIWEEYLVQPQLYDSREPDDQSGGGYEGNQHADIDQVYNDTVMVIVQKASVTSFLLGERHNLGNFIDLLQRLLESYKMRKKDPHIRELIVQTCQNHFTRAYVSDEGKDLFLGQIALAATLIADEDLFKNAVRLVTKGFNENTFQTLGKLICFQKPVIPENHIIEAFSRIPNLYQMRRCLDAFRNGFSVNNVNCSDEHQAQHLASFVRNRMSEALKSMSKAYPQDAAALIETANEFDDKMLEEFIKPFIVRFMGDSNFLNALAVEILSFSQSSSSDENLVANLFPLVLEPAVAQFKLQKYSSASKEPSSRADNPYSSWPNCYNKEERIQHDASIIVGLYQKTLQSDPKKASQLLGTIQLQIESLPHEELDRLLVPLLGKLINVLDLCSSNVCKFYQSAMTTYITKIVEKEPEKPTDWSRPNEGRSCYESNCPHCQAVQEFLMEPGEESRRFILAGDTWHLQYYMPIECELSTDRSQEPPVQIFTKTLKGWEKNHKKWQERASKVQEALKKLPTKELKQCLGEDYDAIMDLRMVKLHKESSTSQTADISEKSTGSYSHEQPQPIVPQKRTRSDS